MSFSQKLIDWYQVNGRELPWRTTSDPYVIWLSEIILQQTRVEQGLPYFYRFLQEFPIVTKFAAADQEFILRLWQGLGYYSRARNMQKAAKMVVEEYGGVFPGGYDQAIRLPGVGEYTAAAIASFSSNEPRAVVDGNVYRVLSRYFGVSEPINSSAGKKLFASLAQQMLDVRDPGTYNQAIMDFGALQCKPKNPGCDQCVFRLECAAYQSGQTHVLPVKIKSRVSRDRYFHYFLIADQHGLLMVQRGDKDVWANLYEFPLYQTDTSLPVDELFKELSDSSYFGQPITLDKIGRQVKHVLSHQNIYACFYLVRGFSSIKDKKCLGDYYMWDKIDNLAKHKLIFSFLEENKHLIDTKL
ncbi:A/G-specific adenine glycosylase [Sphingobacterium sp. JB170]|uniref:A/G-specific adenine glycosylase n=1 Tax=Sphingobacterium sp. JB170 TaxID=1434842 RepID=UPI00097EB65F|nr:A/G-specific adenine glycosylase [Sphingobacterium sp. JB170]SJN50011.1 A/G-specific adenine glycosylase [Sphingobacterium sp. JB170]